MAKTTTQQIDTTTADADAYLRGNKNEQYVDLKKSVDLCDQALKGATDPAQKKALDHELKVRQAAIKKFENLYARAVYHGYAQDLDSSTFAQLAEHVQGKGENVQGYGKGATVANFLTDGKPVNKKAIGLGTALGATTIIAAIVGKAAGVDLTAWLVGTAIPKAATAIFSNVLVPMFALSPTFAIGALAFTALGVPLITKFIAGKVKKGMAQHKVNKATEQASKDNAGFEALKAGASRLTDDQIKNMTFLTDEQRKQLAEAKAEQEKAARQAASDAARQKDANKKSARANFINSDKEISDTRDLTDAGLEGADVTKIQAEAFVARNGQKPVQEVAGAFKKKEEIDLLSEYSDLLDEQVDPTDATKKIPSKLDDKATFGGQSFNDLLAAMDAVVAADSTKKADEVRKVMEEIMNAPIPMDQKKRFAAYLNNYDAIKQAKTDVAYDPTKTVEEQKAPIETELASKLTGLGLETYDPTSADPGQQEQNKRVVEILKAATQLDATAQQKLRDDFIASQMGA